jgi:hypothetical protein
MATRLTETQHPALIAGLAIWAHVPVLLAVDVLLLLLLLPAALLAMTGAIGPAIIASGLTLGPVWSGLVDIAARIDDGQRVSIRRAATTIVARAVNGWRIIAPPTLACAAAATGITANMLLPTIVATIAGVCLGLATPHAMVLGRNRPDRGRHFWLDALGVGALAPATLLAVPATLATVVACLASGFAVLAIVVPAPAIVAMTILCFRMRIPLNLAGR